MRDYYEVRIYNCRVLDGVALVSNDYDAPSPEWDDAPDLAGLSVSEADAIMSEFKYGIIRGSFGNGRTWEAVHTHTA